MKNENDVSKEEILSTIVAQAKEYAAIDFEQLVTCSPLISTPRC